MGSYLSIITLNVNGLNAPTKRQILPDWIQKQDPYICCLQETHFKTGDTYRLKVKGWKKIFHTNGDQKKAGVAIFIPDKVKVKSLSRVQLFATPWTVIYQALHPWDFPGKNTGVGCHYLLQCMKVKSENEVTQSCPTLSNPMDCSPPGSPSMGFSRQEYCSGVPLPCSGFPYWAP